MLRIRVVTSLTLVLMGSIDWLTTVIGIVYFGAVEGNPFLADIARTSLPAFTVIKLSITIIIGLLFYNAEKILPRSSDKSAWSYRCARVVLRAGYVVAMVLLLAAVVNNLLVVVKAI